MRTIFLRSNNPIELLGTSLVGISAMDIDDTLQISNIHRKKPCKSKGRSLAWQNHWVDMPRFVQEKQLPLIYVRIRTNATSDQLTTLFEQKITDKTKSIWMPKLDRGLGSFAWVDNSGIKPEYPFYIISKGRPKCMTARALDRCGVPYTIVIEECDLKAYLEYHDRSKLHVGNFVNDSKSSIPVRNYVDTISPSDWYWLLDDNIEDFNYLTDNQKYAIRTGVLFAAAEDFIKRYKNIGQAGFNYYSFCKKSDAVPAYTLNTRIYSCTLMNRNVVCERDGFKLWRGRYNEDTDLSLRILKAGYCTVLFNAFLAGKVTTQRMAGGNTEHVYVDDDNRLKFAESLRDQHPDVVKVVKKWNRWHHQVDYSGFKQQLEYIGSHESRDYGLELRDGARYLK